MATRGSKHTFAWGEPTKLQGGGTPAAVVELTVYPHWERVHLKVLYVATGSSVPLGLIVRRDGCGPQRVEAGDYLEADYVAGDPVAIIKRLVPNYAYGWREVTPETPWWNGYEMVAPDLEPREAGETFWADHHKAFNDRAASL